MLGYIYKITVGDLGFYIGSTHDLDERLTVHTQNIKTHSQKLYKAIRDNDGEFVMEELHDYQCENEIELRIEERRVYDALSPNLNSIRPHLTDAERIEYQQNYIIEHKQERIDYQNKYRAKNKDAINENLRTNKKYIAQRKQYRIDNKEKTKALQKQKVICDCGCEITKYMLKRHQQTDKHIQLMEAKNVNLTTE